MMWFVAFTVPKMYSMYKDQVDSVWEAGIEGVRDVWGQFTRAARHQASKIFPALRRTNSFQRDNNQGRIRTQKSPRGTVAMSEEKKTTVKENGSSTTVHHKQRTEKAE